MKTIDVSKLEINAVYLRTGEQLNASDNTKFEFIEIDIGDDWRDGPLVGEFHGGRLVGYHHFHSIGSIYFK